MSIFKFSGKTPDGKIIVDAPDQLRRHYYGNAPVSNAPTTLLDADGCPKCCPSRDDELSPADAWYAEEEARHGKIAAHKARRNAQMAEYRAREYAEWQAEQEPELLEAVEVVEPEQEQQGFWSRLLGNKPKQITASDQGAYVDTATLTGNHYFVVGDDEATVKVWRR